MISDGTARHDAPGPSAMVRLFDRPVLFLLLASALLALYTFGTVARFRSLPSPLYGGDLYYQQGVVEHILAGGNPLTSSSIAGGVPGYLPLYPALVAVFAFLFRLTAYDGLRYFAVPIAFLTPLAWYLPFRRLTGNAWWSVIGSLALVYIGSVMNGMLALPVMKYTEFTFSLMLPLFLFALHRAYDDLRTVNAALLGLFYGLLTLSHTIVFIGATFLLAAVLAARTVLVLNRDGVPALAVRNWAPSALAFAAVSLPLLLLYWYQPLFVHHLHMPYDRVHIDFPDYGVSSVRADFVVWSVKDLFLNFSDLHQGIRSLLFLFALYSLVRSSRKLFRDPAVTFLGSLWIASFLATFSFFLTELLLGMNFIPPYLYGLTMPPAFVLPAVYFMSRSAAASRALRSAPASLAIVVVLTALICIRYGAEQKSNRFFRNSEVPLPTGLTALADHIKRTTSVNDVFLSTKELGFMLNGLTGRKLLTNRWLHQNDPYLDLPARDLAAAVILYGNDLPARLALLRQYDVKYLYWDFNWAATEYQVGQNGQVVKMNPLHPLDRPEAREELDRYGVTYVPATTWLDPAVNQPVYRKYRVLLISMENYRRADMPWEPGLDPHLEEVWAYRENGRTVAALYKIR